MAGINNEQRVLRAKYLDWCSARIAERFLALSPDEIYQLAERASRGPAGQADPLVSLSASVSPEAPDWQAAVEQAATAVADETSDDSSFRALIARVTEVLADELVLPTLEEWTAAYSEAPEEFDPDMLGFWREELEGE